MNKRISAEGSIVQTAILIAEPDKANVIMAELTGVGATILSVAPIFMGGLNGKEDVMVVYTVEHECADAQFAHLSWVEDTLGPFCKVF